MSVLWLGPLVQQNTPTASLLKGKIPPTSVLWPSQLGQQNTPTASLQRSKIPPTSVLDITLSNLISNAGDLGNTEYHLLLLLPSPLWPGVVAPDRVLSMDQIELNCELMLYWIVWNRILTFKLRTYAKRNCTKLNYMYKLDLALNLRWLICHKTKPNKTKLDLMHYKKTLCNPRHKTSLKLTLAFVTEFTDETRPTKRSIFRT